MIPVNQAEVECLIVEFNALLGEPTVPGRAATGLERGKFRSILHNIFGITDDTMVDRGNPSVSHCNMVYYKWTEGYIFHIWMSTSVF